MKKNDFKIDKKSYNEAKIAMYAMMWFDRLDKNGKRKK